MIITTTNTNIHMTHVTFLIPGSMPLLVDCKSPRISTAQLLSTSILALKYEHKLGCQEESKLCKFISKRRIISFRHSSTLRRIWFNFMALWFSWTALSVFASFFRISYFLDLSITEETCVVEMSIWCFKIVNVSVLHFF
jgi:hypothetical protein